MMLLAALAGACGGSRADDDGRPRNVILISIDTLRPDHLGCYGHERDTSPTLDAVAKRGVRFTDVTAAAPWTLPSHATMLTGLYPSHHGVKSHETRLPERIVTLGEELQSHGFETFAVVNTWNVGAPQFELDQGFQRFRYIVETEEDTRSRQQKTFNNGDTVVATAKEMFAEHDEDKPFFLFLHFYDVHTDFTPRPEYKEKFVGPYSGRLTGRTQQLIGLRNRGEKLSEGDVRWLREMYDAEIRQLDDLLGRFFGWLDDEGLSDDTLFVITSDHGEEFLEHGSVLHGRTQYQELLRIPLLIEGPGVPAGTVIDTAVHGVDVTPTILALMGIPSSVPRDGLDLSALWKGGTLPERLLFAEADHNNKIDGKLTVDTLCAVRRGFDKLHFNRYSQQQELYDLAQDPFEQRDLRAQQPELSDQLRRELESFEAGAVAGEAIPAPTAEEQQKLDALGYGGGDDEGAGGKN
jgi:arylsulfatase A-like enzyme